MKIFRRALPILCLLSALGLFFPARGGDDKPKVEKPVQISKEQLVGAWKGYDAKNGVAFHVEFSKQSDLVEIEMSRSDAQRSISTHVTQESSDKPFELDGFGEVIALPDDKLRIKIDRGLAVPWVANEAVLERIKVSEKN